MSRALLILLLPLAACGNAVDDVALPMDMAAPDLAAGADDMGPRSPCTDPMRVWPDGGTCVVDVSGQILDEKQQGVSGLTVSVCAGVCFFGSSAAGGDFVVSVKSHLIEDAFALDIHGRPDHASYYTALPPSAPDATMLQYASPLTLYTLGAAGSQPIYLDGRAQTVTAGDVTLAFPQGATLSPDVEDCIPVDGGGCGPVPMRTVTVADPKTLPFVDATAPPDQLYGIAPFELLSTAKIGVTVPNTAGIPAGAAVDVYIQRTLAASPPPAGPLDKVASAHVSQDGATISTDPGEGITALSWIAFKKR